MRLVLFLTFFFALNMLSESTLTKNRNDTSLPQASWFLDQIYREYASESQHMSIKGKTTEQNPKQI